MESRFTIPKEITLINSKLLLHLQYSFKFNGYFKTLGILEMTVFDTFIISCHIMYKINNSLYVYNK